MFTCPRPSLALCSLDPLLLLLQLLLQGSHGYLALVQTSLRRENRDAPEPSGGEASAGGEVTRRTPPLPPRPHTNLKLLVLPAEPQTLGPLHVQSLAHGVAAEALIAELRGHGSHLRGAHTKHDTHAKRGFLNAHVRRSAPAKPWSPGRRRSASARSSPAPISPGVVSAPISHPDREIKRRLAAAAEKICFKGCLPASLFFSPQKRLIFRWGMTHAG